MLLDGTVAEADLKGILERLRSVEGRRHRLKLEQSLIKSRQQISGDRGLSPLNLDILTKRLGQYRSKISSFAFKIKKLKQEISSAKTEVSSAKETVKLIKKQLEIKEKIEAARKKLYGSSHGSLLNYLQARDATLSARQSYFNSLNAVDSKVASMIGKLSDRGTLKADEDAFISKWSSGLGENLSKEQETYIQLKQEILKLKQNMDNIEVRAPVDGIILDIPTVSEGSIVKEGERLLTMVLSNQPLTLEIDVDPKDISDVSLNIPTSVKLDALPFQQYGDLDGKLIYISEDTYTESLSGEKGAFYRGRIHITPTELSKLPPGFQLTSGMLASADMKVGEKHVITYLTYPIIKGFSSAFTEPD